MQKGNKESKQQNLLADAKVSVIGGGSWATALSKILLNNLDQISWWVRRKEVAEHIEKYGHNPNYISSIEFDRKALNVSTDLKETIKESDVIFLVIPSAFLHTEFTHAGITPEDLKDKIIVSAIKGIIPEFTLIPAAYLNEHFGVEYNNMAIVAGPCHAEEVAHERLSYLTIATPTRGKAYAIADLLRCRYINVNRNDDLVGTEYSAIMKNVYAIAAGICFGIGYGDNFMAVLLSNAIRETERFVDHVYPKHRDVKTSAYLGDLLVTAYSQYSRNRTFGNMIGKGHSVKFAQLEMKMVAEGYYASNCVNEIQKKFELELPIADAVYKCLYEGKNPKRTFAAIQGLLK
ncbi:MAG: glycerol-3-phosphate dehydrogenase [Flavobacteriales bacterium]|jgi:glycerol-3-phosphate dehydrogenase (NAD(P)+)|nr:glycerol-3-phosphate dehydrogenase [Flavobacteriales bacterium]|tara:strand:+ start:2656 stop:3696 length:1041 start_codon:yes stop_codon:yes gene_type:complete